MAAEGGLVFPLRDVKLLLLVDLEELGREVEVERRQRLEPELVLVEGAGLLQVVDHDGRVLDLEHLGHTC